MAKILQSAAFLGGVAPYTPFDTDEDAISKMPSLKAWFSAGSMSMRSIDNVWDDTVVQNQHYTTPNALDLGAMPNAGINGRASVRIRGNAGAYLRGNIAIPPSYTIAVLFSTDSIGGGVTQNIISDRNTSSPRAQMFLHPSSGQLALTHDSITTARGAATTVTAGVPQVGWVSYNALTKLASVGLNNVDAGATATFTVDHTGGADIVIGSVGLGGTSGLIAGDVSDVLVFSTTMDTATRRRVIDYLMRKAGLA